MVYVPLGNQPPDQWGGNRSAAVERFSSSVVALDLATGKVRWSFQTVHHDLWDYDVPAQPSLIDLNVGGQTVPALVQPTKQGELYVLDRRTGEPVLPVTEKPAPQGAAQGRPLRADPAGLGTLLRSAAARRARTCGGRRCSTSSRAGSQLQKLRYDGRYTPPSIAGFADLSRQFRRLQLGRRRGRSPCARSRSRRLTYLAFVSQLVPRADDTTLYVQGENRPKGSLPALNENFGAPFAVKLLAFISPLGIPCQAPPWGYVAAADLTTGKIVWKHRNGTVRDASPLPLPFRMGVPNLGGPIMTAGGVAFLSGTIDYYRAGIRRHHRRATVGEAPAGRRTGDADDLSRR